MKWRFVVVIVIVAVCRIGYSRAKDQPIKFDVASVRPGTPPVPQVTPNGGRIYTPPCQGGPGTRDPSRLSCPHVSLTNLIFRAFELKTYQCSLPGWMDSAWLAITAIIPAGATEAELRLMEQDLLAERFKLRAHFEKKEMAVYELTVAKSGPTLKEAEKRPEVSDGGAVSSMAAPPAKMERDADGFPLAPPWFGPKSVAFTGGHMRIRATGSTLGEFAYFLSRRFDIPVQDATGVRGKYDITLTCSDAFFGSSGVEGADSSTPASASMPDGVPTCPEAMRLQLGLQLTRKKGQVDFFVIDHIEKVPTEN